MAGDLHLRDVADEIILRLKLMAARDGRSVETEHGEILRRALKPGASFDDLAAAVRASTAGRKHTPSEILQRESRDER